MTDMIAEIGVNYIHPNRNLRQQVMFGKEMIDHMCTSVPKCMIKLQYFDPMTLCTLNARFEGSDVTMREQLRDYAPTLGQLEDLVNYMQSRNTPWGVTMFTHDDQARLLHNFRHAIWRPAFFKLSSPDAVDKIMLDRYLGMMREDPHVRLFISTGGCSASELARLIQTLKNDGVSMHRVTLMHCVAQYPANAVNMAKLVLLLIESVENGFQLGLSSHWKLDAAMIKKNLAPFNFDVCECHVRMNDAADKCVDYHVSLSPKEFKQFQHALEYSPDINPDKKNTARTRKRWVASGNIRQGELFTEGNVALKRTSYGLVDASQIPYGQRSVHNYVHDEPIHTDPNRP